LAEVDDLIADLRGLLVDLGRQLATSRHRPRPSPESLKRWDKLLELWESSDLPLLLRTGDRNLVGKPGCGKSGRKIFYADNTPAWWSFGLALEESAPDISQWTADDVCANVPLGMMMRGGRLRRDVNNEEWKVCHIEGVSDRSRRTPVETLDDATLRARFRRFISPRNMFLVPKSHAGLGELPEVIAAVREHDALGTT
jgi:hypothetical protein